MSVFAEFHVPTDSFALAQTFRQAPETVIEIERVVATKNLMTPYFWVSGGGRDEFPTAAEADPSIQDLTQVDAFGEADLYRANWTENVESIIHAYTQYGATIFEATGAEDVWELRLRFDNRDHLREFQAYCVENDLSFDLQRLHDLAHPLTAGQYGLTDKQREALVTAWESGYFETPRKVTLDEVADQLGISQQALSNRLRRGQQNLIPSTLTVTPPGRTD